MANHQRLVLFSTDACHLCELAQDIIETSDFTGELVIHDIMDNTQWLEAFQIRIPVLQYEQKELDWPFDVRELNKFLQK